MEGIWGILGWGLGGREVGVIVLEEKVGKWRFLGRESRGKSWWWGESKGGKGLFLGRKGSVSCMACEREMSDITYKWTLQITKATRISICLNPGKEREHIVDRNTNISVFNFTNSSLQSLKAVISARDELLRENLLL